MWNVCHSMKKTTAVFDRCEFRLGERFVDSSNAVLVVDLVIVIVVVLNPPRPFGALFLN